MEEYTMTNQEMIRVLISNYPSSEETQLTEALDKSIDLLETEIEQKNKDTVK